MKKRYFSFILLLALFSCFKSAEQELADREKAQALVKDADAFFNSSRYEKALDLYLKARKLDYDEPTLAYRIAFSYDKGPKDYPRAEEYYLKALKNLNIQNNLRYMAATYFNLGVLAMRKGENDQKQDYFNSASSLFQKMAALGSLDAEDSFRVGYIHWDRKEYPQARKYFLAAIRQFQKTNPRHFYLAASYYNIGLIYWTKEDYNTTVWYWRKAVKLEPDNQFYKDWLEKAVKFKRSSKT